MIYHNGIFVDKATISITHSSFLYGDGVFTTILVKDKKIYFLQDHLNRLKIHLDFMRIAIPKIDKKDLEKLVELNSATEGKWRLKIIVTPKGSFLDTKDTREVSDVFYFLEKAKGVFQDTVSICSYTAPFVHPLAKIKTLAYLDHQLVKKEAENRGYDDAITFDQDQNILEASFANIFWTEGNSFFYPDPSLPYLDGITLSKVILLAKSMGYDIKPGKYTLKDIKTSMSVFLTSSIRIISPVVKIEREVFARDIKLEKTILDKFFQLED